MIGFTYFPQLLVKRPTTIWYQLNIFYNNKVLSLITFSLKNHKYPYLTRELPLSNAEKDCNLIVITCKFDWTFVFVLRYDMHLIKSTWNELQMFLGICIFILVQQNNSWNVLLPNLRMKRMSNLILWIVGMKVQV